MVHYLQSETLTQKDRNLAGCRAELRCPASRRVELCVQIWRQIANNTPLRKICRLRKYSAKETDRCIIADVILFSGKFRRYFRVRLLWILYLVWINNSLPHWSSGYDFRLSPPDKPRETRVRFPDGEFNFCFPDWNILQFTVLRMCHLVFNGTNRYLCIGRANRPSYTTTEALYKGYQQFTRHRLRLIAMKAYWKFVAIHLKLLYSDSSTPQRYAGTSRMTSMHSKF